MCDMKLSLVQAVKDHAKAHYEEGGWDMVVECYEDSEIAEAIEGCTTKEEAIARLGEIAGIYHDRRKGAWADGGLDEHGREPTSFGAPVEGSGYEDDMAADAESDSHYYADDLTGYEEHERDSQHDMYEYCRRHPSVIVSNGMFDGICGSCEGEADEHAEYVEWKEELVASGPTCTDSGFKPWRQGRTCREDRGTGCYTSQEECTVDNEIPF